ncbi:MAG: molybdopterin-dependent oxidoreductase [Deltaproteobacteria bacterium]|nr:molybdopterin-dependent oxidoreductase [Deltaproteobacteria bacterium]
MANGTEITRRDFFKVVGVGGAAATLVGCGAEPPEKLIPYLIPAEEIIPGVGLWYATTCRECPAGCGMVLKTREGRAVKAEGNPSHPVNQGALCARGQASLQGLYNPDRIREPLIRNTDGTFRPVSWEEAEGTVAKHLSTLRTEGKGQRVAFVSSLVGGSLKQLIERWMGALGSHRTFIFEALGYDGLKTAHEILFGLNTIPRYDLGKSQFIISFGADFLETWLSPVEYARGFSAMRSYRDGKMGRFYYVGPRLSLTGANADDWISTRPGTEGFLALGMIHAILSAGLATSLGAPGRKGLDALVATFSPEHVSGITGVPEKKIIELARAFATVRPSLALGGGAGWSSSNATAAAIGAALLNYVVGNIGETVEFQSYSSLDAVSRFSEIAALTEEMNRGEMSALLIHRANLVFSLPEKAGFRDALKKVPIKIAFAEFLDETTAEADVILPMHDPLESWGDYSPRQGVYSLMQPVMRPIFSTRSLGDTLVALAKKVDSKMAGQLPWPSFYDYLRESWSGLQKLLGNNEPFETFWQQALRQGGVWKKGEKETVRLKPEAVQSVLAELRLEPETKASMYLHLYPSNALYDGRGANRPWLQELPDPMTKITWGNWAEIHPQTAQKLGVTEGAVVKITSPFGTVEAPAHIYDGIRADTVALPLGEGHTAFGRYAGKRGSNPMSLISPKPGASAASSSLIPVQIEVTTAHETPASTAGNNRQEGRGIAEAVAISEIAHNAKTAHKELKQHPQLRPPHPHPENRWGMVIDLNACTGCSACMVACSAENNVPVVGRENILTGREMFWIRIERYVENDGGRIENRFLPMLCQHCDNAPCEPVCPTYASYHRPDGLNAQVYNRCVGTRYCSNNCPYKVRRFNWFEYEHPDPLNLQLNPDVTVRTKGVMEKCTFCVQRIRGAKDIAKDEGRPIRDGEITPACVQTCPTSALVFGDLKDPQSKVSQMAQDSRRYRVLESLNTEPAITYLKKIRQDNEV